MLNEHDTVIINEQMDKSNILTEPYVSIIVPYFNRIHYLKELIDSVHEHADTPFELIIHDDASVDNSTPEIFELRNKVSSLIINNGHNIGITSSINRLVNISSSNYIIFLNADCKFITSCFKDIINILSRQYVGCIYLTNSVNPDLNSNDMKFMLVGLQSGSAFAFRKDVWENINKCNENVFSGASDVSFIFSIIKAGYFTVLPYGKRYGINTSYEEFQNRDSAMCMSGYDCSYPLLFNSVDYDKMCKRREHNCNIYVNSMKDDPESIINMGYWTEYINNMVKPGSIDWDIAKKHNHDKWKNDVMNDKNLIL